MIFFQKREYCKECNFQLSKTDRADKKFCNVNCKNAFHNKAQRKKRWLRREVDLQLHCNHDLLIEYSSKEKVSLIELKARGFDKHIFNGIALSTTNNQWSICYDYAFRETITNEQSFILITKNES